MGDNIVSALCDMFVEYGIYIHKEDNYKCFGLEIDDNLFDKYGECSFEEIAEYVLNNARNYKLIMYALDKVFDSPGCDIFVLSIVAENRATGEIIANLNNVWEMV